MSSVGLQVNTLQEGPRCPTLLKCKRLRCLAHPQPTCPAPEAPSIPSRPLPIPSAPLLFLLSSLIDAYHLLHRPAPPLSLRSLLAVSLVAVPGLAFSRLPGLCSSAGGSSLLRTARPVPVDTHVCVCMCVIKFGAWTVSVSVCLVCYGLVCRRCRVWASSRAPGGCPGVSVSVVCALRGSLSRSRWEPGPCVCVWCLGGRDVLVGCLYSGLVGGLPLMARVALSAVLVGWRLLCVLLLVSCCSSCLLMHSKPSRLSAMTTCGRAHHCGATLSTC